MDMCSLSVFFFVSFVHSWFKFMSTIRQPDRRVKRTLGLLRDALMALIQEKGYDSITVQDITDRANVARTTFYLHFKDKDELLFEGMREIYQDLIDRLKARSADGTLLHVFGSDAAVDFEHVAQYADFYRIMLGERGSMAFMIRVEKFLADMLLEDMLKPLQAELPNAKPRIPLELMAYHFAGAQIGQIKWWVDNEMRIPPEEIGQMMENLCAYGLFWAMGVIEAPTVELEYTNNASDS